MSEARRWRAFTFANWRGERSAFFFQRVYGNRELFHVAEVVMYENPQVSGFQFEAECVRFIDELKCGWSPPAQTLPTDADRAAIAAMGGRRFEYHRVDYDHRLIVFRGDGTVAIGGAGCVPHTMQPATIATRGLRRQTVQATGARRNQGPKLSAVSPQVSVDSRRHFRIGDNSAGTQPRPSQPETTQ